MFKNKMIIFIALTAFIASGKAYCQEITNGQQISTAYGTVEEVDPAGNTVNVQVDKETTVFYLSVESDLLRGTHHIASIEIEKGDPVIIQYSNDPFGKNIVIKLVDNKAVQY